MRPAAGVGAGGERGEERALAGQGAGGAVGVEEGETIDKKSKELGK